jgi:hypothetical protein
MDVVQKCVDIVLSEGRQSRDQRIKLLDRIACGWSSRLNARHDFITSLNVQGDSLVAYLIEEIGESACQFGCSNGPGSYVNPLQKRQI